MELNWKLNSKYKTIGKRVLIALLVFTVLYGFSTTVRDMVHFRMTYWAFRHYFRQNQKEMDKQSKSGKSNVYYFTSYYLNGLLSAAEATKSDALLQKAMRMIDQMIATSVTITYRGEEYEAWKPLSITPQSNVPVPNVHYTLQATVPVARAAAIINRNKKFKKRYGDKAKRYIEFADSAVIRYWYESTYRYQVPWIDSAILPFWNDNSTNMGLVALFLYGATEDPRYREVALKVGHAFQKKLFPAGRGWIWDSQMITIGSDTDNTPGSVGNQAGVPDTSHTNREPFLMIFLHEYGLLFTTEDVQRMAYTLEDNIWNQSTSNPSFANYLNGSNEAYRVYKEPGLNGPIYHGWVLVGGYSRLSQSIFLSTLKAIMMGKDNPSLLRNRTGYGGMMGLTGHLLRNFRTLRTVERKK